MSKVRDEIADKLWNLFASELINRLEKGEEHAGPDGSVTIVRPKSPTLAVIAKFLKDNDVGGTAAADDENDPAKKLSRLLTKARKELDEGEEEYLQ